MLIKKIYIRTLQMFFRIAYRISYQFYFRNYPRLLSKMGVNFSGKIENTGFVDSTVHFDSFAYANHITIGEFTTISTDVQLLVHDYSIGIAMLGLEMNDTKIGKLPHFIKDIRIGDYCFIGMKSIILPDTVIGNNSIVGAGSVVKGHFPPNSVIAGNPATVIMSITEFVEKHHQKMDYII